MSDASCEHMSTFTLDVSWASGPARESHVVEHVAGCARCRAYLEMLDALRPTEDRVAGAFEQTKGRSLADQRAPPVQPGLRAWEAAAGAIAAVIAIGFGVTYRPVTSTYVAAKGSPAVQILVHRSTQTRLWDSRSAVRPGDALALRVACEGLERVAVASPGPAGWQRLAGGACPSQGEPLPFTLIVDDAPGNERFAVVLSERELGEEDLRSAIEQGTRTKNVWVVQLTMPKETTP